MTAAQALGKLKAARYFVEKTAVDVPRLPQGVCPTPGQSAKIRGQLGTLIGRAGRLIEVIEAGRQRREP